MLKLEIVTPEKKVLDAEVESATIPTASGEAGILTNHAPLISALKPGILSYVAKGATEKFAISSGFMDVNENRVSVLTDSADAAADIDLDAARSAKDAAEKELAAASMAEVETTLAIRDRIDEANARIQLATGK